MSKTDFGKKPPVVTNLMAASLDSTSRLQLDKALAKGLLRIAALETEDLPSVSKELLASGLSLGEACSLWYAAKHGMVAIGCSGYSQKINYSGIKIISYKEPAKLFGEMQRLHITSATAGHKLSRHVKVKQWR
ncbi:MAG: hypothetical protein RBR87_13955 [Bacteroidales bacterium]|nr:hypothetical protein [Bacteroidales bacterium]